VVWAAGRVTRDYGSLHICWSETSTVQILPEVPPVLIQQVKQIWQIPTRGREIISSTPKAGAVAKRGEITSTAYKHTQSHTWSNTNVLIDGALDQLAAAVVLYLLASVLSGFLFYKLALPAKWRGNALYGLMSGLTISLCAAPVLLL